MSSTYPTNPNEIDEVFKKRRIIVSAGTGGVGKTTVSAAIAVRAALSGKRVAVITIDPAKRLTTSLGLTSLGDHPTDLTPALLRTHRKLKGTPQAHSLPTGTLAAIVPDTRKTFEDFVHELSPSPAVTERVLRNPIFQIFAKEFSGTNEYMALERLFSLDRLRKYDCIVLDTPPSKNTLDFLDAPQLLARFFDDHLIRWLVLPANKIVSGAMKKSLGLLEKLTGAGFMMNLFDFVSTLFEVRLAFAANLKAITELLESPSVGFLMVTTPHPEAIREMKRFIDVLSNHKLHFDGVVLNRTLSYLKEDEKGWKRLEGKDGNTARKLIEILQAREHQVISGIKTLSVPFSATLPEFARDVHSMEDLFHVAIALADTPI